MAIADAKDASKMNSTIALDIIDHAGVFRHGDDYREIGMELDTAIDQREAGAITPRQYRSALEALVERHPDFIDGHAHLGSWLMQDGKPKLALQACLRGLELGEGAIPAGFKGLIEWGCFENRPFLRAAYGAALSLIRLGQHNEALQLMERLLVWNPHDNQGVRWLIGSEYLRVGETEKAGLVFANEAVYPPYHYENALSGFRAGDLIAAATSLRRGFVSNGYIAEILAGNPDPALLAIWHSCNLAEPDTARDYMDRYGGLWRRTPDAIAFVRWLHMHPKILTERATFLECREALLWEDDAARRGAILDREDAALARIDDALSKQLVQTRVDTRGRRIEPWRYRKP
jgi:tetratricopeptide (TPR) repeat protein